MNRYLSIIVGLLSMASTVAGAQWTATTSLPEGYTGHSLTYASNHLYLLGGWTSTLGLDDGTNVLYTQVLSNGMVGEWKRGVAMPERFTFHASVEVNGFLYVLGGLFFDDAAGDLISHSNSYYAKINSDGSLGSWQVGSSLPYPINLLEAQAWSNTIYIIGGYNGVYVTNAVWSANVQSNGTLSPWALQPALSKEVYSHASVVNGMVYVLGGVIHQGTTTDDKVFYSKINPDGSLSEWKETSSLLQPLMDHAAVAGAGQIFVTGGYSTLGLTANFQSAKVLGDGSLSAWSTGPPLPKPVYQHASAVTATHIFITGGSDLSDDYTDVYSMPLTTPPVAPVMTAQGFATNGGVQFKLLSDTNTGFGFQASTNLTDWERIGWGFTGANGWLFFQDTNATSFPRRFYRTYWPLP